MSIEKNIRKYYKVSSLVLLSASILILKAPTSIAMMNDDEDAKISSSTLFKKDKNIDCSSSGGVNHRVSFSLNNLPNEVLYAIMDFLDIRSLGYLSQLNHHFYQVTSGNYFWTHRLTQDKIIPLLGKAWDNSPTHILSYKSYYAAIHFLQNMPKDGEKKVEKLLNLAILADSTFGQKYLCLFYRMLNQKEKVSRCFYRAAELGDGLSQEIVVDAFYKGLESAEEKYQNLLFLAEKGWKYAQDQVVEALSSPVGALYSFGWNETHNEWRYQELVSLAKRGWGGRKGWGSGTIRSPDPFFRVVNTLYEGELGCNKQPGEERYQELLFLAEEGWGSAQEKVVQALAYGKLAQDALPEEERYQKLLIYAEKGWYDAQKIISEALSIGKLGQDKASEEERYQELLSFAERGWEPAQYVIVNDVLHWGKLGWKKRPEENIYQQLFSFAERGWKSAQDRIFEESRRRSIYGLDKRPEKVRFKELVSCAEKGWGKARSDIARYLDEGNLGLDKMSEEKKYKKLTFFAEKGWGDTRYVVYSLSKGKFGCDKMSVEERYNKIVSLAERGDKCAQDRVACAVVCGSLVWNKIPEEERYQKLVSLGERGWEDAQAQIVDALYRGKLGQDQRSKKERYQELIILAEKNWISAQHMVADTHKYNMLGVEYAFCWGPSYDYYGRDLRQRKSRDIPPPYFQKYKNANYFRLLRALVTGTLTNQGFRLLLEEKRNDGTPTILDTKLLLHLAS